MVSPTRGDVRIGSEGLVVGCCEMRRDEFDDPRIIKNMSDSQDPS